MKYILHNRILLGLYLQMAMALPAGTYTECKIIYAITNGKCADIYKTAFLEFNINPTPQPGDAKYDENQIPDKKEFINFKLTEDEQTKFDLLISNQFYTNNNSDLYKNICLLRYELYLILYLMKRRRLGGCCCEYEYLEKEYITTINIDEFVNEFQHSMLYFNKLFLQTLATHCALVLKNDTGRCTHYTFWRRVAVFIQRMRTYRTLVLQ